MLRTSSATLICAALLSATAAHAQPPSFTTLHAFANQRKGIMPDAGLVADRKGNLYGTTSAGGIVNLGTVFELLPPRPGEAEWGYKVLYRFTHDDGVSFPDSTLIIGRDGVLYGTALGVPIPYHGHYYNTGAVFMLTPPAAGARDWTETTLYRFDTTDAGATAPVVMDASGALYGVTEVGGTYARYCTDGCGTVFRLTPPGAGQTQWTPTVLYEFSFQGDGAFPGGIILGQDGALYGTTSEGGEAAAATKGAVFRLAPPAPGATQWTETTLYQFSVSAGGVYPSGPLIQDQAGSFYGTAEGGRPRRSGSGLQALTACARSERLGGNRAARVRPSFQPWR